MQTEKVGALDLLQNLDKTIHRVEKIIVGFGLIATTAIIFANVVARYFLYFSFTWAEEVTLYIMIWVTFIGADLCVRSGGHVNMDFVLSNLPRRMRRVFFVGIGAVAGLFCFVLVGYGVDMTLKVAATGQTSSTLPLPFFLVYLAIPLGCALMGAHFIQLTYLLVRARREALIIDEEEAS